MKFSEVMEFANENQAIQNISIKTILISIETKTAQFILAFHFKLVTLYLTKNLELSNSVPIVFIYSSVKD